MSKITTMNANNQDEIVEPCKGEPVNLSTWAYLYNRNSAVNAAETEWLWPQKNVQMEIVNGSMVWEFKTLPASFPKENVLCGLLWEEPRDIRRITLEFSRSNGFIPDPQQISVLSIPAVSMWDFFKDGKSENYAYSLDCVHDNSQEGKTVFDFKGTIDPFTKLYVLYNGTNPNVCIPQISVFGDATWSAPLTIDIEWGFTKNDSAERCNGRVEVYNGQLIGISPLERDTGFKMENSYQWSEGAQQGERRGISLRLSPTDDTKNNRTVVTLLTSLGNLSFSVSELMKGPMLIPGNDMYVSTREQGLSARKYKDILSSKKLSTVREEVRMAPEENWSTAMKRFFGDRSLPDFPEPPYMPGMKIDVPESQLVAQWNLGAWHLKRWSEKLENDQYVVSIWPFDKGGVVGKDGNEGMVALGEESYQNIRALDFLGLHDIAEGGLNYWLFGEHALPFVWFAEEMGDDALVNPFNSPNRRSPGYDQKHSFGHGRIMQTSAFHFRITGNHDWLIKAEPVLHKACDATFKLRRKWMEQLNGNTRVYGLMPPSCTSDYGITRLFFIISAAYYSGVRDVIEILPNAGSKDITDLESDLHFFEKDFRKAMDSAMALAPVTRINNETCCRTVPFAAYLRGLGNDFSINTNNHLWHEIVMGALSIVRSGIYRPNEPVVQEMLDIYEDLFVKNGQNGQNGYNDAPALHLINDDIPLFLRGMYNGYASEIDPDLGYIFWECEHCIGAKDKTFEEAAFLERVRMMLVMEEGDSLWLARGTPRTWLEQGKKIAVSNAPTFFGEINYTIISDLSNGRISAVIEMPSPRQIKNIILRLRHPTQAMIKSVTVNGKKWTDFNPEREIISLHEINGKIEVTASYSTPI